MDMTMEQPPYVPSAAFLAAQEQIPDFWQGTVNETEQMAERVEKGRVRVGCAVTEPPTTAPRWAPAI